MTKTACQTDLWDTSFLFKSLDNTVDTDENHQEIINSGQISQVLENCLCVTIS